MMKTVYYQNNSARSVQLVILKMVQNKPCTVCDRQAQAKSVDQFLEKMKIVLKFQFLVM